MTKSESNQQVTGPLALPVTTMIGGSMNHAIALGQVCTDACLAFQQEMLRFASARLQTDVETQKSLAGCETLTEVTKIQRDWLTDAGRDYLEETSRLMQMAGRAAQDSLARTLGSVDISPRE